MFCGKVVVKNPITNEKLSVDIDDPRYLSGELVSINKGKKLARNIITGENESVYKNDPRFITGEIVPINKGKKWYNDGTKSKTFYPQHVPDGWVLGRLKLKKGND